MAKGKITPAGISKASKQAKDSNKTKWLPDDSTARGEGRLYLRVRPNGRHLWYWRYTREDGSAPMMALKPYSADARPNHLTLPEARAAAAAMAALYRRPESRDVRAYLDTQEAAMAKARADAEKAEADRAAAQARAAEDAERHTLQRLAETYVDHLRQQGKPAAKDACNIIGNHLVRAHPAIASTPARAVAPRDIAAVLRSVVDAGKGRTAGKLRAFLRAAYALAAKAETDSEVPGAFISFGVETNPVAVTGALSKFNRTRERNLSEAELRAYYAAIRALPDSATRDSLLLGLLLGGQRTAQLVRVLVSDVNLAERTITLRDPKGKRQQARLHVLPLTDSALAVVERCTARATTLRAKAIAEGKALPDEPLPLFTTNGTAPLRPETAIAAAGKVAAALLAKPKAEWLVAEAFSLGDIRRTCETRLAKLGIGKDLRAQLLSHGLSGVQQRHYDMHDYMDEKRAALEAWASYLDQEPLSNVVSIKSPTAA